MDCLDAITAPKQQPGAHLPCQESSSGRIAQKNLKDLGSAVGSAPSLPPQGHQRASQVTLSVCSKQQNPTWCILEANRRDLSWTIRVLSGVTREKWALSQDNPFDLKNLTIFEKISDP